MAHSHNHNQHHVHGSDQTIVRLWLSIGFNLLITLAEVVGGILSNSLSLLSDALHNLSDTASLGISLGARKISRWDPDQDKTFGYNRAEIVGAFINLVTLVLVGLYLIYEGILRFIHPEPVNGLVMLIVAAVGLVGNFATIGLLYKSSKGSLNIKSSFIHMLSDGLSSIGVVIGGFLIMYYHLYIVDTVLTILIALYILGHSYHMLRETINILMESTPGNINIDEMIEAVSRLPDVLDIHHIHIWRLDEDQINMEGHILIQPDRLEDLEQIKNQIKDLLLHKFGISHSTLEFELNPCSDPGEQACHESASRITTEIH